MAHFNCPFPPSVYPRHGYRKSGVYALAEPIDLNYNAAGGKYEQSVNEASYFHSPSDCDGESGVFSHLWVGTLVLRLPPRYVWLH